MIRATVDARDALRALSALGRDVVRGADGALDDAAAAAWLSARSTTLFTDRTGKLRSTLLVRVGARSGELTRTLWAPMPYASYLNDGTRGPYPIVPRRAKFLRFVQNGQVRFSRGVMHPGISARPFMTGAERAGGQALLVSLREHVQEAAEVASR